MAGVTVKPNHSEYSRCKPQHFQLSFSRQELGDLVCAYTLFIEQKLIRNPDANVKALTKIRDRARKIRENSSPHRREQ